MTCTPDSQPSGELPFLTLWYRFLFFDWLFIDQSSTRSVLERHAARQHNRRMSRHLPTYLRRWSALTLAGFALGYLFEQFIHADLLSAWCFVWACVTLTGMVVIALAWFWLSHVSAD